MAIKFTCPKCNNELISEYLKTGDEMRCYKCKEFIIIQNGVTFETNCKAEKNFKDDNNSEQLTLSLLNIFAWVDLIIGFIVGIYIIKNFGFIESKSYYDSTTIYNQFAITVGISFILQGVFAFALCKAIILGLINLFLINENLGKLIKLNTK